MEKDTHEVEVTVEVTVDGEASRPDQTGTEEDNAMDLNEGMPFFVSFLPASSLLTIIDYHH